MVCSVRRQLHPQAPSNPDNHTTVFENRCLRTLRLSPHQDPPEEPTCEAPKNSYTSRHSSLEHGERIDFMFVGVRGALRLETVRYGQPLPELVPDRQFSFSDHEAVEVTLRLVTGAGGWRGGVTWAEDSLVGWSQWVWHGRGGRGQ